MDVVGDDGRSAKLRAFFARFVTERGRVRDQRIEQAFAAVPREPFAGPAPWFVLPAGPWWMLSGTPNYIPTPDDDPAFLYQDVLVALDPIRHINIGEPSLHAHCLDALEIREGDAVLQIGSGSGYYTAIIAQLVGPRGHVHAFEIDPDLAARAERNLAHLAHVDVLARTGIADDLPKADVVYVNAGITEPSWTWLDALQPNGRLLFPLQPEGRFGAMLLIRKPYEGGTVWPARFVCRAGFVACQGRQDPESGRRLAAAFSAGAWQTVKSLHLDDRPDATCWFEGDGWWLSTEPPEGVRSA